MNITLDTNAYRSIAYTFKGIGENEKLKKYNQLHILLKKKGVNVNINFWVLCEIMQHLANEEDTAYLNCCDTLNLMIHLSKENGHIMFDRTFEYAVSKKMQVHESEYYWKNLEESIAKLAIEFVENERTAIFESNVVRIQEFINRQKNQLKHGLERIKLI